MSLVSRLLALLSAIMGAALAAIGFKKWGESVGRKRAVTEREATDYRTVRDVLIKEAEIDKKTAAKVEELEKPSPEDAFTPDNVRSLYARSKKWHKPN